MSDESNRADGTQVKKEVKYVRNQKGHSAVLAIFFGWTTLYILPIYWLVSPNHYYHL